MTKMQTLAAKAKATAVALAPIALAGVAAVAVAKVAGLVGAPLHSVRPHARVLPTGKVVLVHGHARGGLGLGAVANRLVRAAVKAA